MVEEDKKKEGVEFSKEELEAINKDIASAKESLSEKSQSNKEEELKAKIRQELEEEAKAKQAQEEKDKRIAELEAQLNEVKGKTETTLTDLQKKLDDSISSKQVVKDGNPFNGDKDEFEKMLRDPAKVAEIEQASKEAFFAEMRKRTI
jgi:hypothetical protein